MEHEKERTCVSGRPLLLAHAKHKCAYKIGSADAMHCVAVIRGLLCGVKAAFK